MGINERQLPRQGPYLALQEKAKVLHAAHSGLVDADAQAAVPRWEGRGHDLLQADHVPKQPEIVHPPRKFAAAQTTLASGSL